MNLLTIFTPTYNRAYILPQLYRSLCRQTDNRFEWVIVDDGSKDNTKEIVAQWIAEKRININYIFQKNQGKHIAINTGVNFSRGEMFFIVDSDDYLEDDAVEKVIGFWNEKKPEENISGIISYRKFHDGRLVGTALPKDISQCKLRDTGRKYGSVGDKVVIYRTDILKRFPYPHFKNERFLGETYVFNQIDDEYDMLILDEKLYYFAYQKDGLSQDFRELYRNNPEGFLASFEQSLKYDVTIKQQIKTLAHIVCLRIKMRRMKNFFAEGFGVRKIVAIPLGVGLYGKIFLLHISDVKPFVESEK